MAIYSKFGSRDTGHYPYTFSVMPEYNGNGPLTKDNIAYIYPVSTNKTDCDNFQFSSTSHYSPTAHDGNAAYVDLDHVYPSNASWYTHLFGSSSSGYTGVGNPLNHPGSGPTTAGSDSGLSAVKGNQPMHSKRRATSLWMAFSVGTAPHPGDKAAMTYFSLLVNALGAHQGGSFHNANAGGALPSSPRTLFNNSDKILVSGQSYGTTNYRDWVCIAQYNTTDTGINKTKIRIINHGRNGGNNKARLAIYGFVLVHHIYPNQYYDNYAV